MVVRLLLACVLSSLLPSVALAQQKSATPTNGLLKIYLDCNNCFSDFIREEVDIVEYVRDPAEADVHVIVSSSETGSGGRERSVALLGMNRFKGTDFKMRALSESGDTEDTQRQRLATVIKIGLLNYLSIDGVAGGLTVDVEKAVQAGQAGPASDRWNHWVLSLQGQMAMNGEESNREQEFTGDLGADRITDMWKMTFGFEAEYRREDFDLDEDEPRRAVRTQRDFNALVARSLNDHWSVGGRANISSSSFDNVALRTFVGPAIEYNFHPYSQYTRRQLRVGYAVGPYHARYVEETLFFKTTDRLAQQQATITLDQREPWGSLQAGLEYSTFLPKPSRYRLQLDGDLNIRLARGLSLSIEGSTSRIRDQLSIPLRGITLEEVLLRQRRLRSGYEYDVQIGLTYTFGSMFNTIVNPRFGN
ncbi:MAG TPA: hypothetical protein VJM31_01180 [Vicinamibacterales bacterium]|nr:hypothetical protein [Vicinamibacterales bacterium]